MHMLLHVHVAGAIHTSALMKGGALISEAVARVQVAETMHTILHILVSKIFN